jgi:hypothetical protein
MGRWGKSSPLRKGSPPVILLAAQALVYPPKLCPTLVCAAMAQDRPVDRQGFLISFCTLFLAVAWGVWLAIVICRCRTTKSLDTHSYIPALFIHRAEEEEVDVLFCIEEKPIPPPLKRKASERKYESGAQTPRQPVRGPVLVSPLWRPASAAATEECSIRNKVPNLCLSRHPRSDAYMAACDIGWLVHM